MILCGVHLLPQITLADPTRVCDFIYERISRKEPIVCRVIQHITDLKHLFWGIMFFIVDYYFFVCRYPGGPGVPFENIENIKKIQY